MKKEALITHVQGEIECSKVIKSLTNIHTYCEIERNTHIDIYKQRSFVTKRH